MKWRRWIIVSMLILLILLLLAVLDPVGRAPAYRRYVTIKYIINIEPKPGEHPKDVTLLIPLPEEDGHALLPLLESIRKEHEKYQEDEFPDVTYSISSTRYGKMLKVYIPELKRGLDFGATDTAEYRFLSLFDGRSMKERYPMVGMTQTGTKKMMLSNRHTSKPATVEIHKAHIYISFKNATGIIFRNEFSTSYFIATFGQSRIGGGSAVYIGTDTYPYVDKSIVPYEVNLNKTGWHTLPAIRI